jgi:RNA polymerase sigma-70 factor, ECF subfamily
MTQKPTRKAEVTRLLKEWRHGRREALEQLVEIVYGELRRMARIQLSREHRGHTLQATELVHEAVVRLMDQNVGWQNRNHFYGIAAYCMRRILVDHARRKLAAKRPPQAGAIELDKVDIGKTSGVETLLALDEALTHLMVESPRQGQVAELKLFAGLEDGEIAKLVGISEATVKRDWSEARTKLGDWLEKGARP